MLLLLMACGIFTLQAQTDYELTVQSGARQALKKNITPVKPAGYDADVKEVNWKHVSSMDIDYTEKTVLPFPNVGRQAAAIVFDVDKNGSQDIIIAGWSDPSMVWLRFISKNKWERYLIDNRSSHIEAGGAFYDIDVDGDLDIVQGGSWKVNEVWWWENPYPDFDPKKPWNRYIIKNTGGLQHHDQIFGDFDNNGKTELVFWNQMGKKLFIAEIPENPKKDSCWERYEVWSWKENMKYEGFAKADINRDGLTDIIGGGHWFEYLGNKKFKAHKIDDYFSSRSAAGDLIEGEAPK